MKTKNWILEFRETQHFWKLVKINEAWNVCLREFGSDFHKQQLLPTHFLPPVHSLRSYLGSVLICASFCMSFDYLQLKTNTKTRGHAQGHLSSVQCACLLSIFYISLLTWGIDVFSCVKLFTRQGHLGVTLSSRSKYFPSVVRNQSSTQWPGDKVMIVWRQPKAWPGALLCFRPTDGKLGTFFLCSDHFVYKWLWGSITVSSTSTWLSFYQMSTGQVDIQSSRLLFLNGLIYSNPRTNVRIHPQPHEVCFLIARVLCPLTKKLRTDKFSQN